MIKNNYNETNFMQQFDKNPKISAENKKTLKELNQLSRKGVFLKVLTIDNLYN